MENGLEIWNLKFQEPTCSRFKRRIIIKWILKKHDNVDLIHLAQYGSHWDISCEHCSES